MNSKLMWHHVIKGLSARLKTLHWANQIKNNVKNYATGYTKRDAKSQWMFRKLRSAVDRHGKKTFALCATGVYNATKENNVKSFDWSSHNSNDQLLESLSSEMNELEVLKLNTIFCTKCKKRLLIDKVLKGKDYCSCPENKANIDPSTGWEPFLEKEDIIIWRREQDVGQGLYSYKVYGRYSEVTAEDFLAMHIDTDYWRSWDSSALTVDTLEGKNQKFSGQCIIHWEMMWPKLFSNRDYVYVRKYAYFDEKSGKKIEEKLNMDNNQNSSNRHDSENVEVTSKDRVVIVVTSRACEHAAAPEKNNAYRVKRYWSNLIIKPFTDPDKPGIEFSLTYFDDPGTNIPNILQSWVAGYGMPDYLARMRRAAFLYKNEVNAKLFEPSVFVKNTLMSSQNDIEILPVKNMKDTVEENDLNDVLLLQEEKTIDSTQEFLNIIYGVQDKSDSQNSIGTTEKVSQSNSDIIETVVVGEKESQKIDDINIVSEEKIEEENIVNETSEKQSNSNQANNYNYWHLWPLYYFA